MIEDRPVEIEYRTTTGHWEGDTVIGSDRHHCIVILVERKTGFLIIKKIKARTVEEVNKACIDALGEHGNHFKTIKFDNGTEFHGYKQLEKLFPVTCYFATPYHSWERGTNENTNGLIRQYILKKNRTKSITQAYCDRIAFTLNTRPRKRLGFKTPHELYYRKASPLHFGLELKFLPQSFSSHKTHNCNNFCISCKALFLFFPLLQYILILLQDYLKEIY
jgi:transposase, IS30 family